ncbi:hypothetical protein OI25_1904 [Paraburkholderia fungorum]|uniref:Uncharacterized protein n=1 Tax=Paraburkholderia fungorum TaxID=134537 RepID=A0AAU8T0N8_9BURK|nr:hypothetical protein [Paraburkholderia fungorum]AJZ59926.1 hypothetical protein OI25_1904 [Paraburkholderia fungorum]
MLDTIITALVSSGLTVAIAALIGWLIRNALLESVRGRIKLGNDKRLEELKAELTSELEVLKADRVRDTALLGLVHKSVSDSLSHAQEARVSAISDLWNALLTIRSSMPPIFFMLDCVTEDEYAGYLARDKVRQYELPNKDDTKFLSAEPFKSIEKQRLFFGEYLWSVYNAFMVIHVRAIFILLKEVGDGKSKPWYLDEPCRGVVKSLLTPDEFARFESMQIGQMAFIRAHIERKFLAHATRVLNGEENSAEAMRLAAQINAGIAAMPSASPL